LGYAIIIKQTS